MPRERAREERAQIFAREVHLRSILETVPDAMIVIDERGLIPQRARADVRLSRG
jgi:two-component system sensor kinase FixL